MKSGNTRSVILKWLSQSLYSKKQQTAQISTIWTDKLDITAKCSIHSSRMAESTLVDKLRIMYVRSICHILEAFLVCLLPTKQYIMLNKSFLGKCILTRFYPFVVCGITELNPSSTLVCGLIPTKDMSFPDPLYGA